MVSVHTNQPELFGELCEELRLFIEVRHIEPVFSSDGLAVQHRFFEDGSWRHEALLFEDGKEKAVSSYVGIPEDPCDPSLVKRMRKWGAKICVYRLLRDYFKRDLPWGSLTGVRPSKLYRETTLSSGREGAEQLFSREFNVSEEKRALLRTICANQEPIINGVEKDHLDLYIGIPFCLSKCAYCTFSSMTTSKKGDMEEAYTQALLSQIQALYPVMDSWHIRNVYVGGGTPTALSTDQLRRILKAVASYAKEEFTVEAGRPDTITEEKLKMLKDLGVNRLSVNPQTTCDTTLERIGRTHDSRAFFQSFELARKLGFNWINADLIIGLPGEDKTIFSKSLHDVISLAPENITVHTLALKRASAFTQQNATAFLTPDTAESLVAFSRAELAQSEYEPYYMYRQKYMAGNLENVGYTLPGKACAYNIDNMEETMSVLALGAGGISKRVWPAENRIERAACVKDIYHYLARPQEMAQRMQDLFSIV